MSPADSRDRVVVLVIALLVILAPALLLALTVGFLVLAGDLVLGRVTPLEFLELYIIDLVLIAGVGYAIYRLTLWLVENRLPESLDVLDEDAADGGSNDGPEGSASHSNDR
ncbi:MAG: hypothetical protein V5A62_19470 [Haloarculaceae archaeon]